GLYRSRSCWQGRIRLDEHLDDTGVVLRKDGNTACVVVHPVVWAREFCTRWWFCDDPVVHALFKRPCVDTSPFADAVVRLDVRFGATRFGRVERVLVFASLRQIRAVIAPRRISRGHTGDDVGL